MDRDGPKLPGEKMSSPETPFEHFISLRCGFPPTKRWNVILAKINAKHRDPGIAIAELNAILGPITNDLEGLTLSCRPSMLNEDDIGATDTIENFIRIWHPDNRVAYLADPSKDLNKRVNEQCAQISNEEIKSIIANMPDHTRGGKAKVYLVEEWLGQVFGLAFDRTLASIKTEAEKMSYFSSHIDGTNTFAKSVEGLLKENTRLVPSIFLGIIDKTWSTTGWRVSRVVDQLISYGESGLNPLIYGLRIGKNGAIGNDYPIPRCVDITHSQGRIEEISLNPEIVRKKAEDIKIVNTQNRLVMQTLQTLSTEAKLNEMQILFDPDHFGFHFGPQAPCPVTYADKSGGEAYLPQVQLALRTLQIIREYEKEHSPNLPVRLTAALMHQAGKLLEKPIRKHRGRNGRK